MNELLFGEIKEKEALENLLALNQIKKCDKEIEKYVYVIIVKLCIFRTFQHLIV